MNNRLKSFLKRYIWFLVALLPVLIFRDFSPSDELRYISIANEAIANNHWLAFTYKGIPYADVQPLYIWLMMIWKFIFLHHNMWSICLISIIPALAILWVMNRWVLRFDRGSMRLKDGSQTRYLAQFMLLTTGMQLAMSFYIRMEMLFSLFVTLALYNFWKLLYRPLGKNDLDVQPEPVVTLKHHHNQCLFALYIFLACFTHGATGFYIVFLATTAYLLVSHKLRLWWRVWNWRVWGILLVAFGLWFGGAYLEGGETYLRMMLDKVTMGGTIHAMHHHRPWFYLLCTIWADTLPWGPICLYAIGYTLYKKHAVGSPLQSFFLTMIVVNLAMFSSFSSKLDVYLLPIVPYIIYLGVMQFKQWEWPIKWQWRIVWTCRIILLLVFLAGCAAPWFNPYTGSYGDLCHQAKKIRRQQKTEHFHVYKLRKSDGMDAYLKEDPIVTSAEDIAEGKLVNTLLLIEHEKYGDLNKELDKLEVPPPSRGSIIKSVGPYLILKF